MNIEAGFFYKLLRDGDPRLLAGVEKEWLAEEWHRVLELVESCIANPDMMKMQAVETVENELDKMLPHTSEHIGFFINKLRERHARNCLEEKIKEVVPLISLQTPQQNDPLKAAEQLMISCAEIKRKYSPSGDHEAMNFTKETEAVKEDYLQRKSMKGMMGIPYLYEAMNLSTGGMRPGELIVFLAESGLGKTWFLLLQAIAAFRSGHSILIITQEMKPRQLAIRIVSLMSKVSPYNFWKGDLEIVEEKILDDFYMSVKASEKEILIYGPDQVNSIAHFDALLSVLHSKVGVVFWDSPYLCTRAGTWQESSDFVKGMKHAAECYSVPLFITWQLNKFGDVAYTKAILTDADHNFVMERENPDREDLLQVRVRSTKTRDGIKLKELILEWNIKEGRFDSLMWRIPGVGDSSEDYTVKLEDDDDAGASDYQIDGVTT